MGVSVSCQIFALSIIDDIIRSTMALLLMATIGTHDNVQHGYFP
jgi:hypothetical protein